MTEIQQGQRGKCEKSFCEGTQQELDGICVLGKATGGSNGRPRGMLRRGSEMDTQHGSRRRPRAEAPRQPGPYAKLGRWELLQHRMGHRRKHLQLPDAHFHEPSTRHGSGTWHYLPRHHAADHCVKARKSPPTKKGEKNNQKAHTYTRKKKKKKKTSPKR